MVYFCFNFQSIMKKPPNICIIKNRSDIGAGTRGSDLGIDALEIAAINSENDFFNRHAFVDVLTHNESIYNKVQHSTAKRINFVASQCDRVKKATKECLEKEFFPLVLSGDHSSALGTMAGIKTHWPNQNLGVIWIDAHADLHTPFSTPSGNVHGMPLAAALGNDNRQLMRNIVSDQTQKDWKKMKLLSNTIPIIRPEHLVYIGVRDVEVEEQTIMEQLKIKNFTVEQIRQLGVKTSVQSILKIMNSLDRIYLSFDVDSLDCEHVSRGTGTPVPNGFLPHEVIQLIKGFLQSNKVVALEVCEINPLLDNKGNRMAEAAFEVIDAVFN